VIDIIKEYLVSVGFEVDKKGFSEAQKSFDKIDKAINKVIKTIGETEAFQKTGKRIVEVFGEVEKKIIKTPVVGKVVEWGTKLTTGIGAIKLAIAGAIAALIVAITAATAVFMSKMAAVDMQIQKLALSLFTTTQNARSLKAVMDSMGVGSIDELRAVALNPELRAQFMSLRRTAAGLEGGVDVQQGFRNIRSAGLETNRLGVIMNYLWQNLGGKLGHVLAGPLKAFEEFMSNFNKLLIENMPAITDTIAGLLAIGGIIVEAFFKLLTIVTKIASLFNWVGKLLALGIEIIYGSFSGKLAASGTKAAFSAGVKAGQDAVEGIGKFFSGGNGGHISNPQNKPLGSHIPDFLKNLEKNVKGSWHVTSGIRHLYPHDENATGHGKGRKVDIGFFGKGGILGKSDEEIASLIHGLVINPGFEHAFMEGFSASRFGQVMSKYKGLYGSTPGKNVQNLNNPNASGPHIDVLTKKPITISININGPISKDNIPRLASAIEEKFQNAMNIRSNTGSFA
jgi:hypothetical protein